MLKRWRGRAHPSVAALAAGLLVVSLGASGLVAVISDSVTVTGAQAESDDYEFVEAVLDIEIGPVTGGEDAADVCIDDLGVTYTEASAISAQPAQGTLEIARWYTDVAYANGNTPLVSVGEYCVRNAGDDPGLVEVQLLSWESTEIDDCGVTEAAVDTTCGIGDEGELGDFGTVEVAAVTGANSYCKGATGTFRRVDWSPSSEVGTAKSFDGVVLNPGEACLIELYVTGTRVSVPDTQWQQVVSDTALFDVAFNLVEPPA